MSMSNVSGDFDRQIQNMPGFKEIDIIMPALERIQAAYPPIAQGLSGLTPDGRTVSWMKGVQTATMVTCMPIGFITATVLKATLSIWDELKAGNKFRALENFADHPIIIFKYQDISIWTSRAVSVLEPLFNNEKLKAAKEIFTSAALWYASKYVSPYILILGLAIFSHIRSKQDDDQSPNEASAELAPVSDADPADRLHAEVSMKKVDLQSSTLVEKHADEQVDVQVDEHDNILSSCLYMSGVAGLGVGSVVSSVVVPPISGCVNLIEYAYRKVSGSQPEPHFHLMS